MSRPLLAGVWALSSLASGNAEAETRGFAVTAFAPAVYEGANPCPEGFAEALDTTPLLAKVSAAERTRLLSKDYMVELCDEQPSRFKTFNGKIGPGLNLDGSDGRTPRINAREHEDFISPSGERGIDNQWLRVSGCVKDARPGGPLYEYFNDHMRKGTFAILIEIDGLDDAVNDNDVRVSFYRAADPAANLPNIENTAGAKARMQVYYDSRFHATAHGRIAKGILTTEPVDMLLAETFQIPELLLRDARVRMELGPSGQLKGTLGGYQELRNLIRIAYEDSLGSGVFGPFTCYSNYAVAKVLADGYPEPNNRPCEWISVAYQVQAVPATLIHPRRKLP